MNDSSNALYGAIIAASLIGIAVIAYSVATAPASETPFSELYFHGEKLVFGDDEPLAWHGLAATTHDGGLVLMDDATSYGPFYINDTFEAHGTWWCVEDVSDDAQEMVVRNVPSSVHPGETFSFGFVIANSEGAPQTYRWAASLVDQSISGDAVVDDEASQRVTVAFTMPDVDVEGRTVTETYTETLIGHEREVVAYGDDIRSVTLLRDGEPYGHMLRLRLTVVLERGYSIHYWVSLDDE